MRRVQLIVAVGLVLCAAGPAAAQAGRATGLVLDGTGKSIKGATVRAVNAEAYPPQLTSTTDDKGRFAMMGLGGGIWTFVAEAPGFQPTEGTVPIRTGTPGPPVRFVLQRAPEEIPGALPRDIDRQLNSASALRGQGHLDEALSAYQSIQSKNPKLTTLNFVIAGMYRQKAQQETDLTARRTLYDRAMASYDELLKADPDSERARIERALTLAASGDPDGATRALQALIDARPGSDAATEATAHLQRLTR